MRIIPTLLHQLLCPAWKWHVSKVWNFIPIRTYWFCKWCPLPKLNSVAKVYGTIMEKQNDYNK